MRARVAVLALSLCACSATFPLVAKFDNYSETLYGKANAGAFDNGAAISFRTADAKLTCTGIRVHF